jgi:hypothetical protein
VASTDVESVEPTVNHRGLLKAVSDFK